MCGLGQERVARLHLENVQHFYVEVFFLHNCNEFFIFFNLLPRLDRYSSHNSSLSHKSLLGGSGFGKLHNDIFSEGSGSDR